MLNFTLENDLYSYLEKIKKNYFWTTARILFVTNHITTCNDFYATTVLKLIPTDVDFCFCRHLNHTMSS